MLKRVHLAGVLALGLSGIAAAQTAADPAVPVPDQAPLKVGTAVYQSGNASFLTPQVLDSTLTRHLAAAALLLHQQAPLWPSAPLITAPITTIPAPVSQALDSRTTGAGAANTAGVSTTPAPNPSAATSQPFASAAELTPQTQTAAPAQSTFNEDTSASQVPSTATASTIKASAPEAQARLSLPALPSAALTGRVIDLALAQPTSAATRVTQADTQLSRLRRLQAQNPSRPSATQTAAAAVIVKPATVRVPTPELATEPLGARSAAAKPVEAKTERAVPAPVITVNVRVPAVPTALTTSARRAPTPSVVNSNPVVVRAAAPVKQSVTAAKPPAPTAAKVAVVKPAIPKAVTVQPVIAQPVTPKPLAAEPAPTQRRAAAPSNGPVVGATRGSSGNLGRAVGNGVRRTVSATAYSSDVAQTDNSPFVTATGTRVRSGVLAVSRDLLRTFPYGSRVTIQDAGGVLNGRVFIVEDTMNARLRNTIDVWMGSRSQAYQWGRRTVTITALR